MSARIKKPRQNKRNGKFVSKQEQKNYDLFMEMISDEPDQDQDKPIIRKSIIPNSASDQAIDRYNQKVDDMDLQIASYFVKFTGKQKAYLTGLQITPELTKDAIARNAGYTAHKRFGREENRECNINDIEKSKGMKECMLLMQRKHMLTHSLSTGFVRDSLLQNAELARADQQYSASNNALKIISMLDGSLQSDGRANSAGSVVINISTGIPDEIVVESSVIADQ